MKTKLITILCSLFCAFNASSACPLDDTTPGTVTANIAGIEYLDGCTYILLNNATSNHTAHDSGSFLQGRHLYLAVDQVIANVDPSVNTMKHDTIVSMAMAAMATKSTIYAEFTGRTAVVKRFAVAGQ